jgi:hypothetical protein
MQRRDVAIIACSVEIVVSVSASDDFPLTNGVLFNDFIAIWRFSEMGAPRNGLLIIIMENLIETEVPLKIEPGMGVV